MGVQVHASITTAAAAKSLQWCPTLCDPIDSSPPGSPVPGILQARTLEWVAISFSNAWKWKVKVKSLSRVWLLATPWTAAHQAPPSMGFARQEYWTGVPLPSLLCKATHIWFASPDFSITHSWKWSRTTFSQPPTAQASVSLVPVAPWHWTDVPKQLSIIKLLRSHPFRQLICFAAYGLFSLWIYSV